MKRIVLLLVLLLVAVIAISGCTETGQLAGESQDGASTVDTAEQAEPGGIPEDTAEDTGILEDAGV